MADERARAYSDQEGIMSAIKELESKILDSLKSKDPLWWKIIQIILPIALTTILGIVVWYFQSNIQTIFNEKASLLQAQLALSQHLYEKKLVAYKEIYDKALKTYMSLQDMQEEKTNSPQEQTTKINLHNNLKILSELINSNKILSSQELNTFLFQTWFDTFKGESVITTEELMKKVENEMRKDLFVDKMRFEDIFKSKTER